MCVPVRVKFLFPLPARFGRFCIISGQEPFLKIFGEFAGAVGGTSFSLGSCQSCSLHAGGNASCVNSKEKEKIQKKIDDLCWGWWGYVCGTGLALLCSATAAALPLPLRLPPKDFVVLFGFCTAVSRMTA